MPGLRIPRSLGSLGDSRVAALLDGGVHDGLLALAAHGEVTIHDGFIQLIERSEAFAEDAIVRSIELLAGAADRVDERRSVMPVREELAAFVPTCERLAEHLGFRLVRSPLGVVGTIDGVPARAYMRAEGDSWELAIEADCPHDPGFKVKISKHRRSLLEKLRLAKQDDVELGDPILDDALDVRTDDAEALRARLGGDERAHLLALSQAGDLVLFNDGVRLRRAKRADAPLLIRAAVKVAAAIAGAQRSQGPFR
jgi:hypothetical protein